MRKVILIMILGVLTSVLFAQQDSSVISGVEIIPTRTFKKTPTNFYFSGGIQNKTWYKVPMVPESIDPTILRNGNELSGKGWFAGIGASKPTDLHLEFGLMLNFYSSSVPVALEGQRSTSDWVYEMSGNEFTDEYTYNIDRVNNVYSIRTFARYNLNFKPMNFWVAVFVGTFSSAINYKAQGQSEALGNFNHTSLGANGQAGLDYIINDEAGNAKYSITVFADFLSPKMSETIFSIFQNSWYYNTGAENYVVSPVRFGLMLGLH